MRVVLELVTGGAVMTFLAMIVVTCRREWAAGIAVVFHVAALVMVPALALGTRQVAAVFGSILLIDLLAWVRQPRTDVKPTGARWLAGTLLVLAASTLAFQSDMEGLGLLALIVAAFAPPYVLMGGASQDVRRLVMRAVIALAVVQALIACAEFVFLDGGPLWGVANEVASLGGDQATYAPSSVLVGAERSQGTMTHALPLSFLLVVGVGLLLRRDVGFGRVLRYGLLALLVAGCVFAGSRSAILLCVLLVVFYGGNITARGRRIMGVMVAVGGLAWLWYAGFFSSDLVQRLLGSGSVYHRSELVDVVPRLLFDQPVARVLIGNGWGDLEDLFRAGLLQRTGFEVVDNQLVTVLVAGGLAAVVLFAGFLIATWRGASGELRPTLLAAFLMLGIFDVFGWHAAAALFAVVAGMATRDYLPTQPVERVPDSLTYKAVPATVDTAAVGGHHTLA